MPDSAEELIAELLLGVVDLLDLSPDLYNAASAVYDDVGQWMSRSLDEGKWHVYSQGSMRLGTVVRPSDDDEYDIDAVAEWSVDKEATSQDELKKTVGEALRSYVEARMGNGPLDPTRCDESRRCWTLRFTGPLHMDVLPAIPDVKAPPTGILLPDREMFRWQFSNPIAYSEWFFERMAGDVFEKRSEAAKRAQVNIDDIPRWSVRTLLQQVVQVFKLHRMYYFGQALEHCPPSIILTTLAAQAYRGGSSLFGVLMDVAADMPSFIERDGNAHVVTNPVQPEENFADLWGKDPLHIKMFLQWLSDLQRTLEETRATTFGLDKVVERLAPRFGERAMLKSAQRLGQSRARARAAGQLAVTEVGSLAAGGSLTVKDHTFHGD
jgi:hypothetical protein